MIFVALIRTDILERGIASIFRVKRIGKLGTMLVVTGNRNMLQRHLKPYIFTIRSNLKYSGTKLGPSSWVTRQQ
jgi:hypothetical protein